MESNGNNSNDNGKGNSREYILVDLDKLKPFSGVMYDENGNKTSIKGNPFYVPDDYLESDGDGKDNEKSEKSGNSNDEKSKKSMRSLHASIEQEGVLIPLLVRPSKNKDGKEYSEGEYEILSGYRRKKVCEILAKTQPKFKEIPVIVVDCDDDAASSIIASSNIQRKEVSLLDTIISCGRMYNALKHRGVKTDSDKEFTAEIVAKMLGLTPRSVVRYSSLITLPDFLLQLIGNKIKNQNGEKRFSIRAGEALSILDKTKLDFISWLMQKDDNKVITMATATELRKACKFNPEITIEEIERIITRNAPAETEEPVAKKRRFSPARDGSLTDTINNYCRNMSDQEIEDLLSDLLKKWGESANATSTNANVPADTADAAASTDTATMIENAGAESSGAENVN